MDEADGQLHTLSVLEQLREASNGLCGASSEAYFGVDELLRQLATPELARHPTQPALSGRDVGPVRSAYSVGDRGVGKRGGRPCRDGCGDCELSGSTVHAAEWDTRYSAASARVRAQNAISVL
jgi:hypothetical protein